MNDASLEFNKQLELDVLLNGLSEVTYDYVGQFDVYGINEVIIPDGVTSLGDFAFSNCCHLETVTIPTSINVVKCSAFYYCNALRNITIKTKGKMLNKVTLDRVRYELWHSLNVPPENINVLVS